MQPEVDVGVRGQDRRGAMIHPVHPVLEVPLKRTGRDIREGVARHDRRDLERPLDLLFLGGLRHHGQPAITRGVLEPDLYALSIQARHVHIGKVMGKRRCGGVKIKPGGGHFNELAVHSQRSIEHHRTDLLVGQVVVGTVEVIEVILETVAHHERLALGIQRRHRGPVGPGHDKHGIFRRHVAQCLREGIPPVGDHGLLGPVTPPVGRDLRSEQREENQRDHPARQPRVQQAQEDEPEGGQQEHGAGVEIIILVRVGEREQGLRQEKDPADTQHPPAHRRESQTRDQGEADHPAGSDRLLPAPQQVAPYLARKKRADLEETPVTLGKVLGGEDPRGGMRRLERVGVSDPRAQRPERHRHRGETPQQGPDWHLPATTGPQIAPEHPGAVTGCRQEPDRERGALDQSRRRARHDG
jgi:hypothetical protein